MQTQELFVSVAIIDQIISVVVVVVGGGGGAAIFLIKELRTGMCGTFLYFGEQILHTREQVLQTRGQVLPTRL
jgi:hypothetical protein